MLEMQAPHRDNMSLSPTNMRAHTRALKRERRALSGEVPQALHPLIQADMAVFERKLRLGKRGQALWASGRVPEAGADEEGGGDEDESGDGESRWHAYWEHIKAIELLR